MRLFIAEKPELAKAIVVGLGSTPKDSEKHKGYYECGNDIVTWCYGHMMALKDPQEIDEKYTDWLMDTLPIKPVLPAPKKVPSDKKKQVAVIRELVKKADIIVNAGDPDEEGQLLVDELLQYFGNKKQVLRVLINDNTPAVVRKSLNDLKPNSQYEHLGLKAESRMLADWIYGLSLTRAYSLQERAKIGERITLHIGRVQTPILGLVVRRDREHANHKKSFYHVITGDFTFNGTTFKAKYTPKDTDPIDDNHRLIDKIFAQNLANLITGKNAKILFNKTERKQDPAPLPYNLIKLQQDASRLHGLSLKQTDAIAQSLKDKHHLITYHRSDCQYLSDEQFPDVANVITAINETLPKSDSVCSKANPNIKGRAFNSSKVSAHHGIIPTQTVGDWSKLTEDERNIYKLIAKSYLAQFYPPYEYDETKLIIDVLVDDNAYQFTATARIDLASGWKWLYQTDASNEETAVAEDTQNLDLRQLVTNSQGQCVSATAQEHETKPLPLYTETTLVNELTRVAKYVKNPEYAKILREKDKDKKGEHGGIGTPATRSTIVDNLFERGYLTKKGKTVMSTPLGQRLYDLVDDLVKYPDLTAIWHEQQKEIKNQNDVNVFVNAIYNSTKQTIDRIRQDYVPPKPKPQEDLSNNPRCPKCGRPMRFNKKGKFGAWWGCTGWNDKENPCNHSMNDNNGVPVERPVKAPVELSEFKCKKCGKPLIWRKDDKGGKDGKGYSFFGCSGFPKCKQKYAEVNGEPKYD
ncbi:DNA topoisomerase (plasmid) [Moraxella atlantae]|uniref:DNA topoisomerase n=1 Tax=Faucicola atlantae TaxID=34059 RepID=UPI0037519BD7